MPRPGELTKGKSNRMVKTPGNRVVIHRRKIYRAGGRCVVSGERMQLPRSAKHRKSRGASHSSKRPNRPYGGFLSPKALKRAITNQVREQ